MCHTFIFHFVDPFLGFFPTLPSAQLSLYFFFLGAGHEYAFQPYTYSLRPFSWGGGDKRPPPFVAG